jgi:uncharacterized protein
MYALTSNSSAEIKGAIQMLKACATSTGFIHESYNRNDSSVFTKAWFAWANTLFGELIGETVERYPDLLA